MVIYNKKSVRGRLPSGSAACKDTGRCAIADYGREKRRLWGAGGA